MRKNDVLTALQSARAKLVASFAGLPDDTMLRPGVVGLWSVKDILAHLTAWESELVTALAMLDKPNNIPHIVQIEDIDEFNQEQYATNAPRPLAIVLEDFHGVHKHLVKEVTAIDERILTDVRKFRWMEGEPLTYLIMENAVWHEEEHAEEIRLWREKEGLTG